MDITKLTDLPPVVGVAPNAFSRVVPESFLGNYTVICLKKRGETDFAKKDAKVIVAEEEYPEDSKLTKQSTMAILKIPGVVNYLNTLQNPYILIYKPMPALEKYVDSMGWHLIANRYELRDKLENKKTFRELLIESGAAAIPGEIFKADDFSDDFYIVLSQKFGEKIVFQIAEMTGGGGLGTFFINSNKDYLNFLQKLAELKSDNEHIEHVNVTKFIDGIPASIISVSTPAGTITGTVQAQIQDIYSVNDATKGSGLYCGHDFSFFNGNEDVLNKAKEIAKKFGDFIYQKLGYKGIFGMDLLIDTNTNEVYPVECNPRYTDCFPVISMDCLKTGFVPFDYYHILSFIKPEQIQNVDDISQAYKFLNPASQLVLSTKSYKRTIMNGDLRAGIYEFDGEGNFKYVRGGYRYEDLQNENEFLITEGVPSRGSELSVQSRISRLVFKASILASRNKLKDIYEKVIANLYNLIDLTEVNA